MTDLEIFPKERTLTLTPVRITEEKDSTRSDRIFLKKLHSLLQGDIEWDETTYNAIIEVSNSFALSRSLSSWRQKKLGEEIYRKGYEMAEDKKFKDDINSFIQNILNHKPTASEHIHELTTIIFKILKS